MSHLDALGRGPTARARAHGYGAHFIGEAIARGARSPEEAVEALAASPAHCRLLASPEATQAGVWVARARENPRDAVWVIELGRR
jgi:uncharacterized protein YkwD